MGVEGETLTGVIATRRQWSAQDSIALARMYFVSHVSTRQFSAHFPYIHAITDPGGFYPGAYPVTLAKHQHNCYCILLGLADMPDK
jgi:hypothetical protein